MTDESRTDLRWILTVVRRWIWLIVGCSLLAAVVSFFVTSTMTPEYTATAVLMIQPAQDTRSSEYNAVVAGERLALTYNEILTGQAVLNIAITDNQLNETPEQLAKRVTAQPIRDTQLIRLTVKDSLPEQSVKLANGIAQAFIEYNQNLQMERYAGSLQNLQDNLHTLSFKMEDIHSKIRDLNNQKNENQAEIVRLEGILDEYHKSYTQLQQTYQTIQMTVANLASSIIIVEKARVTNTFPNTVTTTILLNQASTLGDDSYSTETYKNLLESRAILETAIANLDIDIDLSRLEQQIRVDVVTGTQLIELSIISSDVAQTTLIADTIADVFVKEIQVLQLKPYIERTNTIQGQIDQVKQEIASLQLEVASLTADNLEIQTEIDDQESQLNGLRSDNLALQQDVSDVQLTMVKAADAVVIVEAATTPKETVQHRMLYIGLAGLVSAALATSIAFLIEFMNDVIRTPEDIEKILNLSTLGSINYMKNPEKGPITVIQPRSPAAEAFRVLATNIQMSGLDRPLRSLLVTSPSAREGKSLTVANLSAAFAQREMNVIAVDADLRLPRLHQLFGMNQENGLTCTLLNGHAGGQLKGVDSVEGLKVLTSGQLPPNPAEVLASSRMRKVIIELAREADLLLLDCPPVLPVTDATILATMVDGVILMVHSSRTRRKDLREAVERLRKVDGCLLGVVLNFMPDKSGRYYQYYR